MDTAYFCRSGEQKISDTATGERAERCQWQGE